jgi:hypothetical protein
MDIASFLPQLSLASYALLLGSVLHAQIPPLDFFGATVLSTLVTPLPEYPTAAVKEACFAMKETCVAVKETCAAVQETCLDAQRSVGDTPWVPFFERTLTLTLLYTYGSERFSLRG